MRVRIIDLQSSQISKIERRYIARELDEYEFSENRKMAITTRSYFKSRICDKKDKRCGKMFEIN